MGSLPFAHITNSDQRFEEFSKTLEHGCPKFFHDIENRCSQLKINVDIKKRGGYNNAYRLASLSLKVLE